MINGVISGLPHIISGNVSNLEKKERQRIANAVFSLSDDGHLMLNGSEVTFGVQGFWEHMALTHGETRKETV